jgi:NAD(P)-dependent dehydrogenase (short-subunit alcohol dehydrogenase family)
MDAVLITGASSGIGADAALLFSQNGYEVILCGRNVERLEAVARRLEGPKHCLPGDLTDKKYLQNILEFTQSNKLKSPLKALVNNAGIFDRLEGSSKASESHYRDQFEVNFLAPVLLTQKLFPVLEKSKPASVIQISSTLGLKPMPGTAHYSSQKAALINWSEALALEWAPLGIRVNCICPGLVATPIHKADLSDAKTISNFDKVQPIGRVGRPRDISEMILFLASSRSLWMTGSVISVDGGVRLI